MEYFFCSLIGYLTGTVNPAYLIGKLNGFDIRERGSGNAGASNAVIIMGKAHGIICAAIDIFKACVAIIITKLLFPSFARSFAVTATACILGHIFPFYMKFRGGKGLACLAGMVIMYDWRVLLALLAAEIVVVLVTNYICFVPMTASIALPIIYGFMEKDIIGAAIIFITAVVIFCKHIINIKRIMNGTEVHLSFFWNKDDEMERIQNNIAK